MTGIRDDQNFLEYQREQGLTDEALIRYVAKKLRIDEGEAAVFVSEMKGQGGDRVIERDFTPE